MADSPSYPTATRTRGDRTGPDAPAPASPAPRRTRRPGWLDLRLVIGIVLVIGSVVVGSAVVSSADKRQPFWMLTHSVSAGTTLRDSDLTLTRIQLGAASDGYVPGSRSVVGQSVVRPVVAGQLLGRADLAAGAAGVAIAIPLAPANGPRLARGDRVIFWLTAGSCRGLVMLGDATIQDVRVTSGGALSSGSPTIVLVRVSTTEAQQVVSALDIDGAVVRAGLLGAGEQAPPRSNQLGTCAAAR